MTWSFPMLGAKIRSYALEGKFPFALTYPFAWSSRYEPTPKTLLDVLRSARHWRLTVIILLPLALAALAVVYFTGMPLSMSAEKTEITGGLLLVLLASILLMILGMGQSFRHDRRIRVSVGHLKRFEDRLEALLHVLGRFCGSRPLALMNHEELKATAFECLVAKASLLVQAQRNAISDQHQINSLQEDLEDLLRLMRTYRLTERHWSYHPRVFQEAERRVDAATRKAPSPA